MYSQFTSYIKQKDEDLTKARENTVKADNDTKNTIRPWIILASCFYMSVSMTQFLIRKLLP